MAVRTDQVGVKRKRRVGAQGAQLGVGAAGGRRKSLPRDEAAAMRRTAAEKRMRPGPAAKATEYERGRIPTTVDGRKKAPSQMKLKRKGGPFKHSRLHGG